MAQTLISYDRMNKALNRSARRPQKTRRRILEAAGRLFAQHGFHGVGFRDIAAEAGVSLQMPNHHFGNKKKLFSECLRHVFSEHVDLKSLLEEPLRSGGKRQARRAIFLKSRACFLAVNRPAGPTSWCGALLGRALTENLVESLSAMQEGFRPAREWFAAALQRLRPGLTPQDFLLWYISFWAQISFYSTARVAILARMGRKEYPRPFLLHAADYFAKSMLNQLET